MKLYFVDPQAQQNEMTVAAINDWQPLVYGEAYEIDDELAQTLLETMPATWSEKPPAPAVPGHQSPVTGQQSATEGST